MLDSLKDIGSFSSLPDVDQKKLLSALSSRELTDFEIDQLLMTVASHGQWSCMKSVLRRPAIRRRLSAMLPQMQDQASSIQQSMQFAKALPKRLDSASSLVALLFPMQQRSWPLAKELIDRGAALSIERFRQVCERYTESSGEFDRKLITCMMTRELIDWQKALGFHPLDDWRAVLSRATCDDDPVLYLCASCMMNSRQKKAAIKDSKSPARVLMVIKHMNLTGKWQDAIPEPYRDAVLGCQLGL